MKNQILLCLLALCSAVVLNAQPMFLSPETITYKVREDTFYSDKAFKEPYRPIKKDSIITWTSEMSVGPVYSADVEAGWYVKYSINASYDENEKPVRMYTDALQVVDSELLTQEKSLIRIIPEYYQEVLSKKDLEMIFWKQPLWLKTLEECRNGKYGADSLEDIFKPESYLLSNTIVSFSQNNYYLVKNIETIGDCKRLALLRYRDDISESTGLKENVYSDIYKKYQKDAYIDLFVRFDGDYVDLWINSKDDFMGRYIIASDVLREQIHNFMETKDIDLSAITWPRHADGTCDYDNMATAATNGNAGRQKLADALIEAAGYGDIAAMRRLIAAGADVNAMSSEHGKTALMVAAKRNSEDIAKLLLAVGADMNVKDSNGNTALMYAAEYDSADVAALLRAAGREPANVPDTERAESVEESAISKPAPAVGKTAAVTENLRLRTDDDRTAEVVATLAAGTRVKVEATSREDTIDGIASNWVRVAVLGEATDRDGNAVAAGTEGWLFGGYLSEAEDAEIQSPRGEADAAKAPALPIAPVAVGVAVLAVLLAAILLAVRRRKGSKE